MSDDNDLRGIHELACELGITQRALRFYEDKGLIEPRRVGLTRIYTKREVARLRLILRGKSLGFSLEDIKAFLDLYPVDPRHETQMNALVARTRERITDLLRQRDALELTIVELQKVEGAVRMRLQSQVKHAQSE